MNKKSQVGNNVDKSRQQQSTRFGFICYPESCPENLDEILNENTKAWAYILHDKDVWLATDKIDGKTIPSELVGQLKKPHIHGMFETATKSTVRLTQADRITKELLHGLPAIILGNAQWRYDYFTHKNHKEKFQYSEDDIHTSSNFYDVFNDLNCKTESEIENILYDICECIANNEIMYIQDFTIWVRYNKPEWNSYVMKYQSKITNWCIGCHTKYLKDKVKENGKE